MQAIVGHVKYNRFSKKLIKNHKIILHSNLIIILKDEIESKVVPCIKSKIKENIKLTLKEKTSMKKF